MLRIWRHRCGTAFDHRYPASFIITTTEGAQVLSRTSHTFTRLLVAAGVALAVAPMVSGFTVIVLPVGANPGALAVIPQTGELAVVNSGSNDVSIIDRYTNHVSTVPAGALPTAIAVNRATGYTYVANSWGNSVTAIYGYGEGKKRKTYSTGVGPSGIAVNGATNRVYVVNNEDGTVTAIDEANGTTTTIPVGTWGRWRCVRSGCRSCRLLRH